MSLEAFVLASMIGILMCWILLPLVPAVLIYWLFPSTSVAVSGPFSSLTVKASGAFAGYLIVFCGVIPWMNQAYDFVGGSLHPAWTITGRLNVVSKDGHPIEPPSDFFQKICLRTDPDVNTFRFSTFTITVPETPGGIPNIYLETGYGHTPLLEVDDTNGHRIDRFKKSLKLAKAIEIRQPGTNDSNVGQPMTTRSPQP